MKVIQPHSADIISTNVAADTNPEWSGATTYAKDAVVKVTAGLEMLSSLQLLEALELSLATTPHKVYKSLRGNNTNRFPALHLKPKVETTTSTTSVAVAVGAKTFTVGTNLSFSAGMVVSITKTVTPKTVNMTGEITAYNATTGQLDISVYSVTNQGTHADWTITTEDEIGFWEEVGATNQWKMFDEYANTQTVNADSINVKLRLNKADHIALFGMDGSTLDLILWDYNETNILWQYSINLNYGSTIVSSISDWFEYFFGEYSPMEDFNIVFGAVAYDAVLNIVITANAGSTAKCGNCVIGRGYELGGTQFGVKAGMVDFSVKTTDDLGRTTLTQGYFAKRNTLHLWVENSKIDYVYKLITSLRGVPTAWLGNEDNTSFESLVVYGTFKDFGITVDGPTHSWCDLEIEGLT